MPPDFARDPYFADLFQPPTLAQGIQDGYNNFYRQQFQQLQNERTGMMNEQMKQQLEIQRTMQEMMQQNPNDPVAAMKAAAIASGNPQAIMQIEREQRMQEQFDYQAKSKILNQLIEAGRENEAKDFYQHHLSDKHQLPDEFFKKKPQGMFAPDGTWVDKNKLEEGMRFDRPQREKEPKERIFTWYKADGTSDRFDRNDPEDEARRVREGYTSASPPINIKDIMMLRTLMPQGNFPQMEPPPAGGNFPPPPAGGNFPPPPAGGNFPPIPPGASPKPGVTPRRGN
jgi:hypothetical protein